MTANQHLANLLAAINTPDLIGDSIDGIRISLCPSINYASLTVTTGIEPRKVAYASNGVWTVTSQDCPAWVKTLHGTPYAVPRVLF